MNLKDRYKSLNDPEHGLYYRGIRLGMTPVQAILYAVEEIFKANRPQSLKDETK
jgi:hypothetical protein